MNKVILIGRLTSDPEIKTTQGGTMIARYRLAVNRAYKKEGQPNADFISCLAFTHNAEFAQKYLHKGMRIAIEGRIQTRSYDAQDGTKRYTTDIVIDHHEFCENKENGNGSASFGADMTPVEDNDLPF